MRTTSRMLIAVFLSLLLPLQAGSALARSVSMLSRHHAPAVAAGKGHATATAAVGAASTAAPLQLAHATGVPHQHGVQAHHEHHHVKKAAPSGKDDASHKTRHAKGHCSDCGKCCVTAAVAPPPSIGASFQPHAVRAAYLPSRASIAAHVPDGPERPPRSLTA